MNTFKDGKWKGYNAEDFRHEGHVTPLGGLQSEELETELTYPINESGLDKRLDTIWRSDEDFTKTRPSFKGTPEKFVFISSNIPEWISIGGTSFTIYENNGKYYIYFNYKVTEIFINFDENTGGLAAEA